MADRAPRPYPSGGMARILAFALDYVVLLGYMALLVVVSLFFETEALFANPVRAQVSGFLLLVFPVVLYFAICESSSWQATWGKRRLRLRVVDRIGRRLTFGRSLARSALKFLPWEIAHTGVWQAVDSSMSPHPVGLTAWTLFTVSLLLAGLYLAGLFVQPSHRTLYDRVAGTTVVEGDGVRRDGGPKEAIEGRHPA